MQRDHAEVVRNDLSAARQNLIKCQPSHALTFMKDQALRFSIANFDAEEDLAREPPLEPDLKGAAEERHALVDRELELFAAVRAAWRPRLVHRDRARLQTGSTS